MPFSSGPEWDRSKRTSWIVFAVGVLCDLRDVVGRRCACWTSNVVWWSRLFGFVDRELDCFFFWEYCSRGVVKALHSAIWSAYTW
jgi:hypothetical protein